MKKIFAMGFAVAAMLGTSIAFGEENKVVGESLDSGLGSLATTYSGSEYVKKSDGSVEWPFAI
jgi:hypothetical protein